MADKEVKGKPDLGSVSETMLQTLYARAKESQKPKHKIYDGKAIETVRKIDYDFSAAEKDTVMSGGVIARTILLDRMVSDWLKKYPKAEVINIASGMDTRFYRIDNTSIRRWFNVDLPEAVRVREQYISEDRRVTNIASSAMDAKWAEEITKKDPGASEQSAGTSKTEERTPVLIIVEGLSMYLSEEEIRTIFFIADHHFPHMTIFFEILNPKFVKKDIEKSISQSGAVFTFGAASGEELVHIYPGFRWKGDRSLVEGMEVIMPVYKVIGKIGPVRNLSNKIAVLEK